MVELSIIIPTLNEEKYIKKLLPSLRKQKYQNFEIIVSDSKSDDKTVEIAKKFNTRIITGPKKGPGYARNMGAKHAKGNVLLFLDADVILKKRTILSDLMSLLNKDKKVVGGTSTFYAYDGDEKVKLMFSISSKIIELSFKTKTMPVAPGYFIFIRKDIFKKIKGFDPDLPFCEDHNLVSKMRKYGGLKMINGNLAVSSRRSKAKGMSSMIKEYSLATLNYYVNRDRLKQKFKFTATSDIERNKK